MTMIWLMLRNQDEVWFKVKLAQMGYAWLGLLVGNGEGRIEDNGWPHKPRIQEYRE